MSPDRASEDQLEASLQRVQQALAWRIERKLERRRWREERRRLRLTRRGERGRAEGFVFAAASVLMAIYGLTHPDLWWLIFPALGFGLSGARAISRSPRRAASVPESAQATPEPGTVPEPQAPVKQAYPAIDARIARVDGICDKLLTEIRTGPQIVRQLVNKPEDTVKALRTTCHELARRERDLRSTITAEDDERLRRERSELTSRIAAEKDDVVRSRLDSAVKALDAQLAQRADLATAASRLDAEATRIQYTLENLHAQMLRARSADSGSEDVAGAGLRRSLEQLSAEMDSVAESLEAVNREDVKAATLSPVVDVGGDTAGSSGGVREKV